MVTCHVILLNKMKGKLKAMPVLDFLESSGFVLEDLVWLQEAVLVVGHCRLSA